MAELLLKQQDCWRIFDELKRSHDIQRQYGSEQASRKVKYGVNNG